jgi:heptosyltransferase II
MKTLIVAPSWVGDAVMSQPLLARLQAKQPGQIDILAPGWVLPVYRRMAEVSETLASPFAHGDNSLRSRWRLGRQIAARDYQRAIVLPNSFKSALVPFFAGIPERVGFTGEVRFGLLNCRHSLDKAALPLMVERFAQLAETPGQLLERPLARPQLQSTPEQQAATLAALSPLSLTRPAKLAVLCPGAEYGPAKRWPTAHFAALARALAGQGFAVWALGSGKDREVGEAIASLSSGACRNLCGHTDLGQAIDLLAMSDLVVTNDSGLMHVAAAVARPLVALFGSSSPGFTPPLAERAEIVSLRLDCSPCFKRECPLGHLDCLNRLTPERVLAACRSALASG